MTLSHGWCSPHHLLALGDVNSCKKAEYDINILCLVLLSGCCHRVRGHPAWCLCSLVAMPVVLAASTRAEMTIPAGWLRNGKACFCMWALCYSVPYLWGMNIWMNWHQLEGFPVTYVLICHFGHD